MNCNEAQELFALVWDLPEFIHSELHFMHISLVVKSVRRSLKSGRKPRCYCTASLFQ